MVRKIKVVVKADLEKLDEIKKVNLSLQMFEIYFPETNKIISKEKFKTLIELKNWLMTLDENLIKKETDNLLKEFKDSKEMRNLLSDENLSLDKPQGRYNRYKYASNYIAITMLGKNIRN